MDRPLKHGYPTTTLLGITILKALAGLRMLCMFIKFGYEVPHCIDMYRFRWEELIKYGKLKSG
jgi:hypothetical protein